MTHRHRERTSVDGCAMREGAAAAAGNESAATDDKHVASERLPLKTVLQNFLNHVETLESQRGDADNTYEKEFQALKAFSDSLRLQPDYCSKHGEMDVNRKKNRYKDILPFDSTRVKLSEYPGVPGSDYINANFVKGASGSNAYIACQGPLPNTVNDFWRMVVEADVQVIVMACNETEAGKHKCEQYWPEPSDENNDHDDRGEGSGDARDSKQCNGDSAKGDKYEEKQFGKFFVKMTKKREICPDFLVRTMRLRWLKEGAAADAAMEERTVCQFHFLAWPDHGIPTQVKPLLEMVRLIRDCQASETLPVLVHCSAGCGRTGTICAIDFIWGLLRTGKLSSNFSLYDLVLDMRRQRVAMVQTVDQYILVHRAVKELFLEQLRVIDAHPYENVDGDGNPLFSNPEEIQPEYETIFVKANGEGDRDIDSILSQRMSQPRTVMGTAMLARDKSHKLSSDEQRPPEPPPKQRSFDPGTIDSRTIHIEKTAREPAATTATATVDDYFELTQNANLLEPAKPPKTTKEIAAQRYKKGQLRLTKTDAGGWKLEETEENVKKSDGKKKKKSKNGEEGGKSELLRRPSIKKLRAFFNKEKEAPVATRSADASPEDDSTQSDSEIASALSKLPKFSAIADDSLGIASKSVDSSPTAGAKSVPNSLDRRARRNPDYANVIVGSSNESDSFWSLSERGVGQPPGGGPLKPSLSSDKLFSADHHRPMLPIKRSKSMKTVTKPVSAAVFSGEKVPNNRVVTRDDSYLRKSSDWDKKLTSRLRPAGDSFQSLPAEAASLSLSAKDSSRKSSLEKTTTASPPAKPGRAAANPDYANVDSDYANVPSFPESKFVEEHLAKLHARLSSADPRISGDLKKSLPLIARSSNSLDDEARRMLKDCQEYLVSTFQAAEREGAMLLRRTTAKNRSAESSPMTTLQKTNGAHLFSSHSTPSNSYNKYNSAVGGDGRAKVSSPPGTFHKSVSSSTGTIQKSFCSPATKPTESSITPTAAPSRDGRHGVSPSSSSAALLLKSSPTSDRERGYSIGTIPEHSHSHHAPPDRTAAEAHKKLASSSSSGGPRSRERSNSFREAVERGKEEADGGRGSGEGSSPKQSYEPIWIGSEGGDPVYANTRPSPAQPAQPQASTKKALRSVVSAGYDSVNADSGGYEPVTFRSNPDSGSYEPVTFRDGQMTSVPEPKTYHVAHAHNNINNNGRQALLEVRSQQLQSVGLVSEAMSQVSKPAMAKQLSSGSLTKAKPPPYKEPPQPVRLKDTLRPKSMTALVQHQSPQPQQPRASPGRAAAEVQHRNHHHQHQQQRVDNESLPTTLNNFVIKRHSRDTARSSAKDDSALMTNRLRGDRSNRSASQVATNRMSLGDFSSPPKSLPNNQHGELSKGLSLENDHSPSPPRTFFGGLPDQQQQQQHQQQHQQQRAGVPLGSPPGVDIDAVAAMMHLRGTESPASSVGGSNGKSLGKTLAVISGAAANLRSRFSLLSGGNSLDSATLATAGGNGTRVLSPQHKSSTPPKAKTGTEMSPSVIPITVPGADSNYPYAYPNRLESRPLGPRDAPTHFQRKQEYL